MEKTKSLCLIPVLSCINSVEDFLEVKNNWEFLSFIQREFIDEFLKFANEIKNIDKKEVSSIADINIDKVNKWIKDNGFDIQLQDRGNDLHVAAFIKVFIEWLNTGENKKISYNKNKYEAILIEDGIVFYDDSTQWGFPIISIPTKNKDIVKLTILDYKKIKEYTDSEHCETDEFFLHYLTKKLNNIRKTSYNYKGAIFPKVKFDTVDNLKWIIGLKYGNYLIKEAIQQTKFNMDEYGVKVDSAAAMGLYKCCAPQRKPVIIDKPFLIWINRKGINVPIFCGKIFEDTWIKA